MSQRSIEIYRLPQHANDWMLRPREGNSNYYIVGKFPFANVMLIPGKLRDTHYSLHIFHSFIFYYYSISKSNGSILHTAHINQLITSTQKCESQFDFVYLQYSLRDNTNTQTRTIIPYRSVTVIYFVGLFWFDFSLRLYMYSIHDRLRAHSIFGIPFGDFVLHEKSKHSVVFSWIGLCNMHAVLCVYKVMLSVYTIHSRNI